jgi:tetratricopeptide (TPR) repeat protein
MRSLALVACPRSAGTALAVAVVLVLGCGRGERASRARTGDVVLLADLANESGDSALDRGLDGAAAVALQQSRHLRLYPRSRLPSIYALMRLEDPDTPLTYELAREVAERDRVRFVVGLTISRTDDGYRVTARVADVTSQREVARLEQRASLRGEVIGALDDVLARVRRALGESRRDVAHGRAPLPRVTTASLEALRSYDDGSRAWVRGDYRVANELWRRAVDLDTGFAMALGALGAASYYARDRASGERYFAAAFARADRLTEWERLRLLQQHAVFGGHDDSALVLAGTIAQRFPSADAWYGYGTSLMRSRRSREAIDALTRALAFDSLSANTWINLATTHAQLNQFDEAVRHYLRAGALDSMVLFQGNVNHEYGRSLVALGRHTDAEAAYRRMAASPRLGDRALGLRSLGWLAFYEGRLYEAIGDFQQAIEASRQMRSPFGEGRSELLLAGVYRAMNRTREAQAALSRALAVADAPTFTPDMLGVLLYACAQLQRGRDAEIVASRLRARVDSQNPRDGGSAALAAGVLHLLRQRYDSALVDLRRATGYPLRIQRHMLMAAAFDGLGQRDSVRAALEAALAERGFGIEGQDDWLRVPLLLGDALLQSADTAAAVARYRELLARWQQAPPDAPDLVAARARLAGLSRLPR